MKLDITVTVKLDEKQMESIKNLIPEIMQEALKRLREQEKAPT